MTSLLLALALCRAAFAGGQASSEGPETAAPTPVLQTQTAPQRLELTVPAPAPAADVKDLPAADVALSQVQLPALEPVPGLLTPAAPTAPDTAGALLGWRTPEASADFSPAQAADAQVALGREQFDRQSSRWSLPASVPSVRRWLSDLWKGSDRVPAWPGQAGETVKIDGTSYELERKLGDGNSSAVWLARSGGGEVAVKFIHPEFKNIPHYGEEVLALEALARTQVPHARLLGKSADGLVIAKEYLEGDTAARVLESGGQKNRQSAGLAELAARLIAIGYTADLAPSNLVWQKWRSVWALADAGGFAMGRPVSVLSQILDGPLSALIEPAAFLSALRGRLGPDSAAWRRIEEDAARSPDLGRKMLELSAYDRSLKPAPSLRFAPAPENKVLDDTLVSWSELRRRLGFDPRAVKTREKLHGDDPGKLNTVVLRVRPEGAGGRAFVTKEASFDIVRSELAVRAVIKRWFAPYFETPAALGVKNGWQSLLVMENVDASPSYHDTPLTLEQRAAFAVVVHTFGLGDVNPGNLLSRPGAAKASLIDFEQAFGRHRPVVGRLPDERILAEMPWMSGRRRNRVEDYLPAARQWRALLLKDETQAELARILAGSGFSKDEIPGLLALFKANAAELEWAIQADCEFANLFVERRSSQVNQ